MQISNRFSIGVHILVLVALQEEAEILTSEGLAASVGVNPVIVRKVMSQLRQAQLIQTRQGLAGIELGREPAAISLFDIYQATGGIGADKLFRYHDAPNPQCEVGRTIHGVLDHHLQEVQAAMELPLKHQSLADILKTSQEKQKG
ncbi:Rrf2 family transcriptional regulator [Streptococcus danieliae]|nr:Rrf2 family transcriptional regulator [Streptococcus danieliae]